MREIKFRAWDDLNKKWFMDSPRGFDLIGECILFGEWGHFFDEFLFCKNGKEPKHLVIEQFTGLTDKNGKEIYKGDILRFIGGTCDYLSCGLYDYQVHVIGATLVVSDLLSGFTLQMTHHINQKAPNLVGNVSNYNFWNHQKSFKIIGNIHDNPELL